MAIAVEPALSPHLVVDDAAGAIDFYVKAFDAQELGRVPGPDGKLIHAALRINGFTVLLNDDFPEMSGGKSMTPTSSMDVRRKSSRKKLFSILRSMALSILMPRASKNSTRRSRGSPGSRRVWTPPLLP